MVLIDQNQLNELMMAKKILESQKIANATAQLQQQRRSTDYIESAFDNSIFSSAPHAMTHVQSNIPYV